MTQQIRHCMHDEFRVGVCYNPRKVSTTKGGLGTPCVNGIKIKKKNVFLDLKIKLLKKITKQNKMKSFSEGEIPKSKLEFCKISESRVYI